MQQLFVIVVFLSLLQACSSSQPQGFMNDLAQPSAYSSQPETLNVASTSDFMEIEFNLNDYQWQHRIVLIFASSERSPVYQQQMQAWQAAREGIRDRDLKLVEVLGTGESRAEGQIIAATSANRLRQQFGVAPEDFAVILIGKDGTEKQREQVPIALAVLFHTIDAMPMRQQEMRSRQ